MDRAPRFIRANGLEFGYLEAGPVDGPLVLCAHGFPDSAHSFAGLLDALGAAGYHAVSPFMRGYLPTALPADRDYRATTLGRDLIALIDHLGARKAVIIGHDWGAVAAYSAAAQRPDRLRGIVCAAIPHLRRFLLRPTFAQLARSSYMLRFQWPDAESMLAANDFAALRALAQRWSPTADLAGLLEPVIAGFRDRQRLSAALGYYRALPRTLVSAESWSLLTAVTPVPALVLFGREDDCIAPEMFTAQDHLFSAGYAATAIERAGHFLFLEQPAAAHSAVLGFLQTLN